MPYLGWTWDQAIRVQAQAQGSCRTFGLPQAYRGWCQPIRTVSRTVPQLPRQGRTGDFQVPYESTSIRVKWQLRQCRRLRTFRGGVAKLGQSAQPSDALLQQLFNEWEAIKRAKGFGMPFLSWVLTWPCVEICPVDFPSWEWVNDVMQLVEFSCQALAAQDSACKSRLQAFQIQEDLSLGHSRESFAALRGKHKPPFSAVSTCVEQPVHGVQPQGLGEYHVRVPFPSQFRPGLPVQMGSAQGLVVAILSEDVHVALGEDMPDTAFPLCQQLHDCTPSELQDGFFRFWEPLWNRDSVQEATDLSLWPSFLELLRQSPSPWPSATLDMSDIKVWRHVLRRTSSRRASGACGFSVAELQQLPDTALRHLISLCEKAVVFGFPDVFLQGRVNVLAKTSTPTGYGDGRPICILPVLYRLWSSVLCAQLLQFWSDRMPSSILGGLSRRSSRNITHSLQHCIETSFQRLHAFRLCIGLGEVF